MTPFLLQRLCDPQTREPLTLEEPVWQDGRVMSGWLVSPSRTRYPIRDGIPRFVEGNLQRTVDSFGDEWNHFNFTDFKRQWLTHTVQNTFGSLDAFAGKVIVDAGGGSGAQSLWMLEAGASHVILLELSHSVDDVVLRNIDRRRWPNVDIVQCSIDQPPLRDGSIDGIVICHNVIQHTPSVERTARALYAVVAPGGEFVFNCYQRNDDGLLRWIRFHLLYRPLRGFLSRQRFGVILAYARTMAALRLVPGLGIGLEKLGFAVQGEVPRVPGERGTDRLRRRYRATALNTFDGFGSHAFQHHLSEADMRTLVSTLEPPPVSVGNLDAYFHRPPPIGCALRIRR